MKTMYSKILGEVKIISQDANVTKVIVVKSGEEKRLANKFANLQETPFAKQVKPKAKSIKQQVKEWEATQTPEQMADFERRRAELRLMEARVAQDKANGRYGAISLWK
jgi:hypothetical protein